MVSLLFAFDGDSYDIGFPSILEKKFFGRNFSVSDFRFSDFDKIGSTDSIELKRAPLSLVFDSESKDIRCIWISKKKFFTSS